MAGLGVQIGAELREGLHVLVLSQLDTQVGVGLLHGLGLGCAADTGDGQAHVDSRAVAGVEQSALEEDLTVGDGDDVGGDVSGHVACLSLNDGQCGDGATAQCVAHAAGALQQTGVQIEDIAGVSLTARRAAEQQGDGTVCHRVLGEVIVDDEDALALRHEILGQSRTGVRCDVLQRGAVGSGSRHDGGVAHGTVLLQVFGHAGDGRSLLTDGDVDAEHAGVLLVQDGIGGDRGLAGLAVADDQLTLTAANGEHGVDGEDAGVERRIHALALEDAGGLLLDGVVAHSLDGAFAVDGLAQRVDDAAKEAVAHRDAGALAAAGDHGADADGLSAVEEHDAQTARLDALHHALGAILEGDDLAVDGAVHAFHFHDAVGGGDDHAALFAGSGGLVVLDAGLEGGQRGLVGHHLVNGVAAGVIEDAVADLQHIAGEEAVVHRDVQDDLGGVVQLRDLFLDALQVLLAGGTGGTEVSFDDAVGREELGAEFTCHFQPPLSPTGRPAGGRRPARSGCGPAASRTWRGPVQWSGRQPGAACAGARLRRQLCPRPG